jgi:ABC-2 type transport system ATP-binding protein
VHDPQVLILDEPAAGLDPRARVELREILRELQRMGKTILLSSHILSELEEICNRIGIVEQGRLVAQGSTSEILDQLSADGPRIVLRTTNNKRALELLNGHTAIEDAGLDDEDPGIVRVKLSEEGGDIAQLSTILAAGGIGVRHLSEERMTLEQAFMRLTRGLVQ